MLSETRKTHAPPMSEGRFVEGWYECCGCSAALQVVRAAQYAALRISYEK